jgi:four helix bundle protein
MKKNNVIQDKSYRFALRTIRLYQNLVSKKKEYVLSRQVLRSGTAIGAMIEEGIGAESRADFVHKLSMANKECKETHYWIRLLRDSEMIDTTISHSLLRDCEEIGRILASIILTTKNGRNS